MKKKHLESKELRAREIAFTAMDEMTCQNRICRL